MKRNVYLEGELGEKFGSVREMHAENIVDVMNCLSANFEDFFPYYTECYDKGIVFAWKINNTTILSPNEISLPLGEGDMIVTPVPVGASKLGDALKLVAGVLLTIFAPPIGAYFGMSSAGVAALGMGGKFLGNKGLQDLLSKDPAQDPNQDSTYVFSGSDQAISEVDPIPICYGRLRVPGRVISFQVANEDQTIYHKAVKRTR
jgi:predicted phage tail protein